MTRWSTPAGGLDGEVEPVVARLDGIGALGLGDRAVDGCGSTWSPCGLVDVDRQAAVTVPDSRT